MRLIDANALVEKLREVVSHKGMGAAIAGLIIQLIEAMPTIEAEPIRYGRWVRGNDEQDDWICSECGLAVLPADDDCTPYDLEMNLCHRCGARMKKENNTP